MFEDSDSFRDVRRPEALWRHPDRDDRAERRTKIALGYEHLHDTRVADRGITSFQGRPADVDISTYYGNPDDSHVRADVDLASATIEHRIGRVTIRNQTLFGDYDRSYQNFVPGAVSADKNQVTLSAYNNDHQAQNLFNQTDITYHDLDWPNSAHAAWSAPKSGAS